MAIKPLLRALHTQICVGALLDRAAFSREVHVRRRLSTTSGHIETGGRRALRFKRLGHVALHVCVQVHVAATIVCIRVLPDVVGRDGRGHCVVTGPRVVVRNVLEASWAEGDFARFVLAETLLAL